MTGSVDIAFESAILRLQQYQQTVTDQYLSQLHLLSATHINNDDGIMSVEGK